ncbi:DUF3298 domain-containing protein [Lysobacter sp. TY2-98]|uniref:DUF3298 and DUF4163 domain-containing protein n=1 Tax=Lysobacter sp. TY2-98 TaxID=2290922 RepID=UPI000E1FBBD5|nr:DUF3298 and DUF4163 domain-containing protein [Lysobacter sp. TY2-98]AXK72042.1 DUF3298 domain-containing protein [Lysobacter sp. TY2-98]
MEIKDVLDTSSKHVIGVSYPKDLSKYPGLAALAQRYAAQARQQVLDAERQRPPGTAAGPYELSLEFQLRHESPQLVVLAVDGSTFTGGAHSTPMIQRWVWLPAQNRQLTAAELFPQAQSWQRIATDVRTQLQTELQQRLDADEIAPHERAQLLKSATAMIEGGTEPKADDFAVFEPVFDDAGHISALRFVFPPYQVGPFSDGTHTVELPAAQLVQDVAPAYRALFATTG